MSEPTKSENLQAKYDDAWKRLRQLEAMLTLWTALADNTEAAKRNTAGALGAYYDGKAAAYREGATSIAAILEGWEA